MTWSHRELIVIKLTENVRIIQTNINFKYYIIFKEVLFLNDVYLQVPCCTRLLLVM